MSKFSRPTTLHSTRTIVWDSAAAPLTINPQNGSETMISEHFDVPTALLFADGNIAGVQAFRAMLDDSSVN
jgi:hypothetical protein